MHTAAFATKEYPQCRTAPIWILGPTIDALQIAVQGLQRREILRLHFVVAATVTTATLIDILCSHTDSQLLLLVVKRMVSTLQGHSNWLVSGAADGTVVQSQHIP
jgi:hypothetical protein